MVECPTPALSAYKKKVAIHEQNNLLKTVGLSTEQNYNMISDLLNNAPVLPPQPPEEELDKLKELPNKHRTREREGRCQRNAVALSIFV